MRNITEEIDYARVRQLSSSSWKDVYANYEALSKVSVLTNRKAWMVVADRVGSRTWIIVENELLDRNTRSRLD